MKTLQHIFSLSLAISIAAVMGCKEQSPDERGHAEVTHTESAEEVRPAIEATNAHEELPEDIVEMDAEQIKIAGIQLGKVEMRPISGVINANGVVSAAPQNLASVSVPFGGFIKSSELMPGSAVRKGQTLAIIENSEFVDLQQLYFETKSKYEYAEAEYTRHTELYKEDVYSEKNVQQTTAEYRTLKAQLKGIEQKLMLIGIDPSALTEDGISASIALSSPISGYIKTTNISMGKYVSPADVIFEIVNTDNLLLELSLFEKDANAITVGQSVQFSINNESHRHTAKVYQVGKSINDDKTYKVYATVQPPCPNVLPGMYVLAHIEKKDREVASVPSEAVVSFDNKSYIFSYERDKQEDGRPFTEYRFIEVTAGDTNDGFIEIRLPASFDVMNTRIVTKGAYVLLSAKKNAGEMTCG